VGSQGVRPTVPINSAWFWPGDTYQVFFPENGDGIPLLGQPTAGCHNHQWRNRLRDPEVTRNFRRGGSSNMTSPADFFTEFIANFAGALELDRPVFMGSSMGGVVCLYPARDHPEQFRALIALEAADFTPGFYADCERTQRLTATPRPPRVCSRVICTFIRSSMTCARRCRRSTPRAAR
jgi:pimeloyl-ACP methyl ester carboxylesterase